MARASKAELELRISEAASMLAQGNGASVVTSHVAETYRLSRRQSRRITAAAYKLLEDDLNEMDLSRPQLTSQLVANLQSAIQKSLVLGKPSAVASNARALIDLCGKMDIPARTLLGAWITNLNVRPEQDWKKLKGRAVTDE